MMSDDCPTNGYGVPKKIKLFGVDTGSPKSLRLFGVFIRWGYVEKAFHSI